MSAERRICPRFHWNFPVSVTLESGGEMRRFHSHSINVSRGAIEIAADGAMMAAFQAQRAYPHVCTLDFELPELDGAFRIDCQLTTHRRLSQHRFQLVLMFTGLDGEQKERLSDHLLQQPVGQHEQQAQQRVHFR